MVGCDSARDQPGDAKRDDDEETGDFEGLSTLATVFLPMPMALAPCGSCMAEMTAVAGADDDSSAGTDADKGADAADRGAADKDKETEGAEEAYDAEEAYEVGESESAKCRSDGARGGAVLSSDGTTPNADEGFIV